MSRGGETQVRVYQGSVEKYVSADSAGVGVRVITDGRTGFAYAGTLDESALDEVVAEARDNVTFGTVDEWAGLAEPDGVPVTEQSLWSDELAGVSERGQDRAGPRIGDSWHSPPTRGSASTTPTTPTGGRNTPSPRRPESSAAAARTVAT